MEIGIVFSGGAARCIAQLGVLKALEEIGIRPHIISAVSGGALIGVLYASGISPDSSLELILKNGSFKFFFPSIKSGGLFSMSRLENAYKEVLSCRNFEELKVPMVVNATDILKGEPVFFSSGELIKPIIASASYPAIFEPVTINGRTLLDGGITNNFPVEPLKEKSLKIIGVSVGKVYGLEKIGSLNRVIVRSLELAINEGDLHRYKHCDVLIEPTGLNLFGMFDSHKGKDIFQMGYQHTIGMAREIGQKLAS